jgi:hypothetical protein
LEVAVQRERDRGDRDIGFVSFGRSRIRRVLPASGVVFVPVLLAFVGLRLVPVG